MKFHPHKYQLDAARFHLARPYSALFADPGLGKTAIMLMLIHEIKRCNKLDRPVLVLSTLRIAKSVWPAEIAKWDQFNNLTYTVIHGSRKGNLCKQQTDVHLLNNEGLAWAEKTGILDNYKFLIVDESSKYKSWGAQRTKIIRKRVHQFERRHILTGTPVPKSMLDIFSQMYLCDAGRSLGRYITHFRNNYFIDRGWGMYPDWQLRDGAEQQVYDKIGPRCFRLSGEHLLDMPELMVNDIMVDIPKKYQRLSIEMLSELGILGAINGAGKYAASRRIASGVGLEGVIHTTKLDALKDLISELQGKPILVAYYYRNEGDLLQKEVGAKLIDGRTSAAESDKLMRLWNAQKIPVLGIQPAAGGHGLNLQEGGLDICWYSLTDNQDDYYQLIRRVWRQGVRDTVRVHRLLANKTVDLAMVKGLESKTDFQTAFLAAIEEMNNC